MSNKFLLLIISKPLIHAAAGLFRRQVIYFPIITSAHSGGWSRARFYYQLRRNHGKFGNFYRVLAAYSRMRSVFQGKTTVL